MNDTIKEKIDNMIDKAIQKELCFETDNITSNGWDFLENSASEYIWSFIKEDFEEDEFEMVTEKVIADYLDDAIYEYEKKHPNIRCCYCCN